MLRTCPFTAAESIQPVPSIPSTIPELGSTSEPLRPNPVFDPRQASSLTTRDYYVFSRIDGSTSLRDLILMVGLGTDETIDIVRKLRGAGAVLLQGETEPPAGRDEAAPATSPSTLANDGVPSLASPEVTGAWAVKDPDGDPAPEGGDGPADDALTEAERRALAEDHALESGDRRRIIEMRRVASRGDYFEILGVDRDAGKRDIKRAYFRLSKEFHPDRFYGVETGSFGPWLADIFETVTRAYSVLSSPRQREAYEASARGEAGAQTPEEHAEELFRRGGDHEARGELAEALKLFEASIRVRATVATIRRAAECALRADHLDVADAYARRAVKARPDDPSLQRLLASVLRARGDLDGAEALLSRALEVKGASDVLAKELAADLESVRRARAEPVD